MDRSIRQTAVLHIDPECGNRAEVKTVWWSIQVYVYLYDGRALFFLASCPAALYMQGHPHPCPRVSGRATPRRTTHICLRKFYGILTSKRRSNDTGGNETD
nr:MAG TPA: hypothetical protein [Caudoviricetes sp.]